jgi:unsaturated rhamnogalacturonyl hydrolase
MIPVSKIVYRCECLSFIWGLMMLLHTAAAQSPTALQVSCKVADKVIRDTRFEWKQVAENEVLGIQLIDFRFLQLQSQQKAYALRYASVASDTLVRFGITSADRIQVWINKQLVWQQDTSTVVNPDEFAYDRFNFHRYFTASLHKGDNEILILCIHAPVKPVVFLRAVTVAGDQDQSVNFSAQINNPKWLYAGPFPADTSLIAILPVYNLSGKFIYWQSAPQILLPELVIDSQATYQRESYADWHYAHGTTVWSIQGLENATGYDKYKHFIKKYTGFLLDNMPVLSGNMIHCMPGAVAITGYFAERCWMMPVQQHCHLQRYTVRKKIVR